MQSEQEDLINLLMKNSMGASFVFEPDFYNKGTTNVRLREPVDLVWASNNCIILMEMTKSVGSAEKMFKHNSTNLKRWLKLWKMGTPLRGRTANQEFDIKYDDYRYKILLSIVDGPNATAEYHKTVTDELNAKGFNVKIFVTIPQTVLHYLAMYNGSMMDLLLFIYAIRKSQEPLNSALALLLINNQHERAFQAASPSMLSPNFERDADLAALVRSFRETRGNDTQNTNSSGIQSVLNDLAWTDVTTILYSLNGIRKQIIEAPIGNESVRHATAKIICPSYVIFIDVTHGLDSNSEKFLGRVSERMAREFKEPTHPDRRILWLMAGIFDKEGSYHFVTSVATKSIKSATETALELWED